MSNQVEELDFLKTVKELMRLTREGVLDWSVDYTPNPFSPFSESESQDRLPTYKAKHDDLEFIVEDAAPFQFERIASQFTGKLPPFEESKSLHHGESYRLKIKDKEESITISSPPMKPIRDLVSVIKKEPKKEKKLKDINNKLSKL